MGDMWSAIACLSMLDHSRGTIGGPLKARAIFSVGVGGLDVLRSQRNQFFLDRKTIFFNYINSVMGACCVSGQVRVLCGVPSPHGSGEPIFTTLVPAVDLASSTG